MDDDELAALQRQLIAKLIEIDHAQSEAMVLAEQIAAENERRRDGGTVHPIRPADDDDEGPSPW